MGCLQVSLIGLLIGIDFQDIDLAGVGLVLHGEETDDAWFRSHGDGSDLFGEAQVFLQQFGIDFDLSQSDNSFPIFPDRDIGPEQAGGVVCQDVLWGKAVRGQPRFQGFLGNDKGLGGDVRIV